MNGKMQMKFNPYDDFLLIFQVRRHRDFLTLLPEKIVLCILNILDPKELCKCAEVIKKFTVPLF